MKIGRKRIILLAITCIFLYLVFVNIDVKELIKQIQFFDKKYIILLCISIILSLACRGICFQQLISKTVKAPLTDLIPLCITGAALNIVLPARAGDFFRAYYTGQKYKADKVKIFGSVMLERIFDGLVILSMLFLGIILYHKSDLAQKLCYGGSFVFISGLILAFLAFRFNKTNEICTFAENKIKHFPEGLKNIGNTIIKFINKICNSFLNGFEVFRYPEKLFLVVVSSMGIWFFECLNYYIMILGFGLDISKSVVLFIISFIALACMIPSTSIFIGPYQFAVIAAFSIYDVNKETALALSFIEQTIVAITTSLIAAVFLIKNNTEYRSFRASETQNES